MEYCERKNIRIPGEISIVGFDNIAESAYTSPPLTTVDTHREETGREAVRLVAYILSNDKRVPEKDITIKPSLLVRESTCPFGTKGGNRNGKK